MLINRETTINLKCPACGLLTAHYLHAFSFSGASFPRLKCSCDQEIAQILKEDKEQYFLLYLCPVCEEEHVFSFSGEELWSNVPRGLSCPDTGEQLGKIGPQNSLSGKLETIAEQLQGDDFFLNPELVLQMLDRLQEIAANKGLSCQCGSFEVHVDLFPDRIKLVCRECTGELILTAYQKEDLNRLKKRISLLIPGYTRAQNREKGL